MIKSLLILFVSFISLSAAPVKEVTKTLHTPSSRVPPVKAQAHAKPVKTASTVNIAKKMVALAGFVSKPA